MRTLSLVVAVPLLGLALTACSSSSKVGPVRFVNAPPVERVDDRRPIPQPGENKFLKGFYHLDSFYIRGTRGLMLTRDRRALGVNSFDEVPDSTWFTNRVGPRALTNEQITAGPGPTTPEEHFPWTIKSSKEGGTALGFVAEDARGVKFVLKFDYPHVPEAEGAASAVVARLLWASGYNVPADHVVYFKRSDVKVSKKAYTKVGGKKQPIDEAYFDGKLKNIAVGEDGRIRAFVSTFITGEVLGGTHRVGVRKDDPNDLIPHELRRDQRGQAPIFAWLSHTDAKEDNTLDTWQEDPANKAVHYVMHYLIDFGNSLGTQPMVNRRPAIGYRHDVDPLPTLLSIATLGLWRQTWEFVGDPKIRGVGLYSNDLYNPAEWKANTFAQLPLVWADRFDQFWGSKILIRFTPDQLAAALKAGRYSDPRAPKYLLETMIARQRTTARYWFRRVNPIDEFSVVAGAQVCFTDLALRHKLETIGTSFKITAYDAAGKSLGATREITAAADGRACLPDSPVASGKDNYTILRIHSSRSGLPDTLVHLGSDAAGQARVIGIHRL